MPTQAKLADEFGVERGAVRQALRILQSERLLVNVSKGSPATVADDLGRALTGPEAPPQPTTVALGARITEAFAASHVEIDALCLTSISLTLAMSEPLRQIHAERIKPARIDVRVLLPSGDIPLAFPAPVEATAEGQPPDGRLQRNWLANRNAQGQVLRHNLLALRATHGIEVNVTFRALPFTPPVKLYLLNGSEALFAYYTLTKREEEIDHVHLEMYDVQGTQSMLFPFMQGPGCGTRPSSNSPTCGSTRCGRPSVPSWCSRAEVSPAGVCPAGIHAVQRAGPATIRASTTAPME